MLPAPAPPAPGAPVPPPPFLPVTRVTVPRISLAAEVVPARFVDKGGGVTWEVPAFRAGHAETTAGAGRPGNAVLLGHVTSRSAGDVFKDLDKARVGDWVQVFSGDRQFDYQVVDVREVARTDISVLQPTELPSISLITCTGVWLPVTGDYAERLVVRAALIGPVGGHPQPTPAIPPASPAPVPTLRAVFEERFADNRGGWPDDPRSTAWFADGGYRLAARQPGRFVAVGAPIAAPLGDVAATATFRKVGGPPGGGYGLIVRDRGPGPRDGVEQGGRYYVLEAGDRGEVGVWRREGDRWVDLLPWTPSEAVRPGGAANELTARAQGARLTLLVNGVEVAGVEDAALPEGGVGIFVGGDLNEVAVDRFVVELPR